MRRGLALLLVALPVAALAAAGNGWVQIPGGSFRSALKYEDVRETVVAPFGLQKRPVTNAEFLAFVKAHPQWRRDRVATVLAETRYLSHWKGPETLGDDALPEQPVVQVRSEEHTSELPSLMRLSYAVFCLKKNNSTHQTQF